MIQQQVVAEVENAKSVIINLRYIFTNNEKKRVLEKSGIDVIHIINLLSILGKPPIKYPL